MIAMKSEPQKINAIPVVIFLVCCGTIAQYMAIANRPLRGNSQNEDAAAHVLATSAAWANTSWKQHLFLPLITMNEADRGLNNLPTASLLDQEGYVYYTSFPPGLFLFPHAISAALASDLTPRGLRVINMLLGLLSAGCLGRGFYQAAKAVYPEEQDKCRDAACLAVLLFLLAPESLRSFSISYWGQQLYLPLMILAITSIALQRTGLVYYAIVFVGPLIEWSAYPVNLGLAIVWIARYLLTKDRKYLWPAIGTALLSIIAVALLAFWYSCKFNLTDVAANLVHRQGVRSTNSISQFYRLLLCYQDSLGLLTMPCLILLYFSLGRIWQTAKESYLSRQLLRNVFFHPLACFILLLCFALIENAICARHAETYTFDRLKFVVLVAVACGWVFLTAKTNRMKIWWGFVLLAGLSVVSFWLTYKPYRLTIDRYANLGTAVQAYGQETLLAAVFPVRGAELYHTKRNFVELNPETLDLSDLKEIKSYLQRICYERKIKHAVYFEYHDADGTYQTHAFEFP